LPHWQDGGEERVSSIPPPHLLGVTKDRKRSPVGRGAAEGRGQLGGDANPGRGVWETRGFFSQGGSVGYKSGEKRTHQNTTVNSESETD